MNKVQVKGICKSFAKQLVLNDISFNLNKGEVCYLLGPNGAGKTTLMKTMVGLLKPDKGEIILDEDSYIGNLIEKVRLYEDLSAYDNLKHQAILRGCSEAEILEVMKFVKIDPNNKKKVGYFSNGMRQRIGIAKTLLGSGDLIILDEPLNGLDPSGIKEVKNLIEDLVRESSKTLLISSHLIKECEGLAQHYVIIDKGRLVKDFKEEDKDKLCRCLIISKDNDKYQEIIKETAYRYEERGLAYLFNDDIDSFKNDLNNKYHQNLEIKNCDLEILFLAYTHGGDEDVNYD